MQESFRCWASVEIESLQNFLQCPSTRVESDHCQVGSNLHNFRGIEVGLGAPIPDDRVEGLVLILGSTRVQRSMRESLERSVSVVFTIAAISEGMVVLWSG